jgi:pimeloyl-ACP methyl ester carboxylesterase
MRYTSETTSNGVVERLFTVDEVPGALWTPAHPPASGASQSNTAGGRPLVLLGHGGGTHKKTTAVLAHAHHFVTTYGFAAAAIDAPWHGDRPRTAESERLLAALREAATAGGDITAPVAEYNAAVAAVAVTEWRTTLAALTDSLGTGPVGYWGVSMGTVIGVPLVAAEPRVTAAVLGLAGHPSLDEAAAEITVPVRFLVQWHDELVPRAAALSLFDAFASPDKTLHANPGRHRDVPAFELASSGRFLNRHLTA